LTERDTSKDAVWVSDRQPTTQAGQLVMLVTSGGKRYLTELQPGRRFHSHLGILEHDDLIGLPMGTTVHSQLGHPLLIMEPSLSDLMVRIRRSTQIIYPKDAAYLVHKLSLRSGSHVIEAGTGSGALTIALAWAVSPGGKVYTYESRPDNFSTAEENLKRTGLLPYVKMHQESIQGGFRQTGADAVFLDMRAPWLFIEEVRAALRPGGFFASLVPTTNQVTELLATLEKSSFAEIQVEELLLRKYKAVPERLRPDDNMIGHTGFLVSARPVVDPTDPQRWLSEERKRFEARQEVDAYIAQEEERRAQERKDGGLKYPKLPLP
jgi:tRNA (adenine57-N1/adenine58-N1)-methyltransferase catalytic subunit